MVEADRLVLVRTVRRVTTPFGRIRVKVAQGPDDRLRVSAEYDDCKRAAQRTGQPLAEIVRAAEQVALREESETK